MGVNRKCRVAFIGAGYMTREHAKAFASLPDVELAGISSRTRARAEVLAADCGIPLVADGIHELHQASAADLVVVSVPELSMTAVALACFEHDWTVLLEKPAGYNLAEAERIRQGARVRNRRAYVALNRRHYASTQTLQNRLNDEPRFIRILDQEDTAAALAAGQPSDVVAHWMYANSIHLIDLFRVFGRGSIEVTPIIEPAALHGMVIAARLQFSSGDVGLYEALWDAPGPWSVEVATRSCRWEMRPIERLGFQPRGTRGLQTVEPDTVDLEFKPGLRRQAEQAVRAARGLSCELPSLDEAWDTMQLIARIYGHAVPTSPMPVQEPSR